MTETDKNITDYEVDLTTCDREPIHVLGAVQSFGFLIAVSMDWVVARVSANATDFLDAGVDTLLGSPLSDFLGAEILHTLRGMTQGLRGADSVERAFGVPLLASHVNFDIAMYISDQLIVIEAEPSEREQINAIAIVRSMIGRLQATQGMDALLREAVRQLRVLTGFDRVMTYRFDHDGSGEVVTEALSSSLEPYKGLRYPASDIPKQARALYLRNGLRLIHDTTDFGSRIVPQVDPSGRPLDLSMSVLRSVSPIHLEYLSNMGVRASMSVSIIVSGKLWGLFACHHMEPRRISFERRTAAELFGEMFSWLLDARERDLLSAYEDRARGLHDRLMSAVAADGATMDAILGQLDPLSDLVSADGIGVWIDGRIELQGSTPSAEEFTGLVRHFNRVPAGQVFVTNELGEFYSPARDFIERAAGALVIPISRHPRDYLIFFRREQARTVTWAGDPSKPVTQGPSGIRLTPRKSFEAWRDIVRGQSAPWKVSDIRAAESLRVTLLEVILRITDASDRERRSAQDRQELLIAELNHRVRNILGLIRGLVTQTQGSAATVEEFTSLVGGRIQALARAHDQVTTNNWGPASLSKMIRLEAQAYLNDQVSRVQTSGLPVMLEPTAFSTVAMVMHELMTNAAKYGALTEISGYVTISWDWDKLGRLVIKWREQGGPAVQAPTRKGFGSTIIERSIPYELKGEADINYVLTGLQARFVIPASYVTVVQSEPASLLTEEKEGSAPSSTLSGRVLLVEDNMLIALDVEDMLLELGAEHVNTVASVEQALRIIESDPPTFALLDINLGAETSIRAAEALFDLNVPFIFATGYGEGVPRPAKLGNVPVLSKPYTIETLRKYLGRLPQPRAADIS